MPTCNVRLRREARSVLTNGQVGAAEDRDGEGVMEDVTSARGPEPLRTCAMQKVEDRGSIPQSEAESTHGLGRF